MRKNLILMFLLLFVNSAFNQSIVRLRLPANCNIASSEKTISADNISLVEIVPNPTTGIIVLHVNFKELIGISTIKVYDDHGKLMYVEQLFCDSMKLVKKIDLSILKPGFYVLEVQSKKEVKTTKLIIK